jgi:hypothetical protein
MRKNTTPVVDAISEIQFTGNIIPHTWYQCITVLNKRFNTSSPYLEAICILSDICNWYLADVAIDDSNNEILEKKFSSDMLQKSYNSYSVQFGFSKTVAKNAIDYLVENDYIKREFRTIHVKNGDSKIPVNNVMYLEPNPVKIKEITSI